MTKSVFSQYRLQLRRIAYDLLGKCAPNGPPYDPFLIAKHMQVNVHIEAISGLDGFIEVKCGKYFAVISSLTNRHRQRFTLSHELGHVLFMRDAAKGSVVPPVRYRSSGCPPGLHQDPIEEALCNEFASELLLPTGETKSRVTDTSDPINSVLELSSVFDVSCWHEKDSNFQSAQMTLFS
jgi:IrrE N-terminal-like domain